MERLKQTLRFNKCLCCCKNYNASQLLELSSNAVIIGEETEISFNDLLLDVFLQSFDDDKPKYLCEHCKDQLVFFHMFKRDVKKYSDFQTYIKRLKLLSEVDAILSQCTDLSSYSIHQSNETIIVSKEEIIDGLMPSQMIQDEMCPNDKNDADEESEMVVVEEEEVSQVIEEEYIDETDIQEQFGISYENQTQQETVELTSAEEIVFSEAAAVSSIEKEEWSENSSQSSPKRKKKYVYKVNTNDDLTEQQLQWIREQVRKSEIQVGGKRMYRCQICGQQLRISGSLKKHLRDSHLLKSKTEQEQKSSRQAFKDEIKRSKIEIETSEGIETIWKCQRCRQNRIFRSEPGLKVHLRYNHIRDQVIDVQFIAKCKISMETSTGIKDAWMCPNCRKILRSRDGLRNHFKLEHPESAEQVSTTTQSSVYDLNEGNVDTDPLDKSSLLQLARRKPTSTSNFYCCEQCGINFVNGTTKKEKSHDIHQQLHIILKVISKSYDLPRCLQCKIMFSNNEDLNVHSLSHDTDEVFPAEGLSFLVAEKLNEPLGTATLEDIHSWKCGHCPNARFGDEIDCIEHQMILHSKQLICPFDYLEFNGIRGLGLFASHMKNKHPEMFPELSIVCTYCGQVFTNVFDKLSHMKRCETKQYSCDHCDKTFFKKTQLIRHLKIVSGAISFICSICSKNCASSMDLKLHYRAHTNEKTYQCTFPNCFKIFKTPAARSSHMEVHSSTEYECVDCKQIFKQRALLQRHLKKVKCKGSHAAK